MGVGGGGICVCYVWGGGGGVKRQRSKDREIDDGVMWRPHIENARAVSLVFCLRPSLIKTLNVFFTLLRLGIYLI